MFEGQSYRNGIWTCAKRVGSINTLEVKEIFGATKSAHNDICMAIPVFKLQIIIAVMLGWSLDATFLWSAVLTS